jgi:membrane-associated phospholipid phosphatase
LASLASLVRLALTSLAFAVLAVLVGTGVLSGFDQYAVDHWMPGLSPGAGKSSLASGLLPYHRSLDASDAVTLPAGFLVSLVIVLAVAVLLERKGRRLLGLLWIVMFLAGNAVEALCKTVVSRPALYGRAEGQVVEVAHFQNSFPSGHALRSIIVAAVLLTVWRRGRWALRLWAAAVLVALLLDGIHAATDILGGALLAGVLIAGIPLLETALSRLPLPKAALRPSRQPAP